MPGLTALAPPGWSQWVEDHKGHDKMENPFAMAWFFHDQGLTPKDVKMSAAHCTQGECAGCHQAACTYRSSGARTTYHQRYAQGAAASAEIPVLSADTQRRIAALRALAFCGQSYDQESEKIAERKKTPEAQQPHDFQSAEWTHPNGHPRCKLCGDEESTDGKCPGLSAAAQPDLTHCPHCQKLLTSPQRDARYCDGCGRALAADLEVTGPLREQQGMQFGSCARCQASINASIEVHAARMVIDTQNQPDSEHPNRWGFKCVLHQVDEPSTRAPSGSGGKLVMIPREVAARRLDTLLGMPINVQSDMRGHDTKRQIGTILAADIGRDPAPDIRVQGFGPVGPHDVVVAGFLHPKNNPEDVQRVRQLAAARTLGASFEVTNVKVRDQQAQIWILDDFAYIGAALLLKRAAAYEQSQLAAAAA